MATFTSNYATANVQPRTIHAGVNSVYAIYTATATLTQNDTILMCKVPDNARIVDVILSPSGFLTAEGTLLSVGTPAAATQFITSVSANVAGGAQHINVAAANGAVLDVSDSGGAKYTMIQVKKTDAGTTGTSAVSIAVTVLYTVDQYTPGITP